MDAPRRLTQLLAPRYMHVTQDETILIYPPWHRDSALQAAEALKRTAFNPDQVQIHAGRFRLRVSRLD